MIGQCQPAKHRCCRGFTLLEVLVVVAIIALLIAILLPSLANARRQAQRTTCQTQLHQILVGWQVYLDANAGRFPHGQTLSVDYGGRQGTYNQYLLAKPLNKYLHLPVITPTADVYRCPSDSGGTVEDRNGEQESVSCCYEYYGTSYKANRFLVGAGLPISPVDPCQGVVKKMSSVIMTLTRSQLYDQSRLVLVGDLGWEDAWNVASSNRVEWHARPSWHNIGFMDGHADFTHIRKGIYVDPRYTVLPLKSLQREAAGLQKER